MKIFYCYFDFSIHFIHLMNLINIYTFFVTLQYRILMVLFNVFYVLIIIYIMNKLYYFIRIILINKYNSVFHYVIYIHDMEHDNLMGKVGT